MVDVLLSVMAVLSCLLLSFGYALRGGQYVENKIYPTGKTISDLMYKLQRLVKGLPHEGRWYYIIPCSLFVFFIMLNPWLCIAFSVLHFATIVMGHGVFFDMGRYMPINRSIKSKHQGFITKLIGRERYSAPFWIRYIHNFAGMAMLGFLRWGMPLWVFYQYIDINYLILNSILSMFIHPICYEIGWWVEHIRVMLKKQERLDGSISIFIAEHLAGLLLPLVMLMTLVWGKM